MTVRIDLDKMTSAEIEASKERVRALLKAALVPYKDVSILLARIDRYEQAISVNCANCAKLLDQNFKMSELLKRIEQRLELHNDLAGEIREILT